jgi:predicted nuclease of predicted toxin-antitoxin system
MSRLFIHFYLDEDVSVIVAKLLRSRGFETTTTLDAGQLGASDAEQMEFAVANQCTIVTHNRAHFESLAKEYHTAGKTHHGIVIAVRRPANQLAQRLLILLDNVTSEEMRDQVRYI